MMRVADLQGAHLDYWVARAEGLEVSPYIVEVKDSRENWRAYNPSTNWAQGGPLIEKYQLFVYYEKGAWRCEHNAIDEPEAGDTPLQAICRAVVRAAFGDEVPDINE